MNDGSSRVGWYVTLFDRWGRRDDVSEQCPVLARVAIPPPRLGPREQKNSFNVDIC
jgi:hypothetical protein